MCALQGRVEVLDQGRLEGLSARFMLGYAAVCRRQKSCLHPRSSHPKIWLPGRTKRLHERTLSIVRPVNVKLPALLTASHWGRWPPSSSLRQWKSFVSETHDVSLVGIQAQGLAK